MFRSNMVVSLSLVKKSGAACAENERAQFSPRAMSALGCP
jgi:hypothetical protein